MALAFLRKADIKLFVDGTEVVIPAQSFSVKRNAGKHSDGVLGEDRDRLDSTTNSYDCQFDALVETLAPIFAFFDEQSNKDANAFPTLKIATIRAYPRDGSKATMSLQEVELDDWGFAMQGRTSGAKLTVPFRARYFKKGKA